MATIFDIHALIRFDLFGTSIPVPVGIVVQWAVMVLVFLVVWFAHRRRKLVPGAFQNFTEILAATLRKWTSRWAAKIASPADGSKPSRRIRSESLSALFATAALFILAFWVSTAVTTLSVAHGPMAGLAAAVTPIFDSLRQHTLLGPILARFSVADIGAEISAAIQIREAFGLDVFGLHIAVADVVVVMWVVMAFLFLTALWIARDLRPVPKGKQLIAENLVDSFQRLCRTVMEPEMAERYAPFIGSLCLFIGLCNITSVIRLPPPAKNPAFPISLALTAIAVIIFGSIREVGLKGFGRSLIYPTKAMLPFKLLEYLIKLVSLSMRLFGNIFGAFILMEFVYVVAPILLPGLLGLWFDLADGVIQGLVFAYLTALYVGEVVENAHHAA